VGKKIESKLCINGLTAQSVITSGEKGSTIASQFGHGIGAMAGMFIGGGVTGAASQY